MSQEVGQWSPAASVETIHLTDAAINHIKKMLAKSKQGFLRFGVKKAGCSGFAYVVEIAHEKKSDEEVFQISNIEVHINLKHLPMLVGTTIDYVREGLNHRFKFSNPNEKGSCGCGESFSV